MPKAIWIAALSLLGCVDETGCPSPAGTYIQLSTVDPSLPNTCSAAPLASTDIVTFSHLGDGRLRAEYADPAARFIADCPLTETAMCTFSTVCAGRLPGSDDAVTTATINVRFMREDYVGTMDAVVAPGFSDVHPDGCAVSLDISGEPRF